VRAASTTLLPYGAIRYREWYDAFPGCRSEPMRISTGFAILYPFLGGPDRAVLTSRQEWRRASRMVIEIMCHGGEFTFRALIRRAFNSDVNTFITFYHSIFSSLLFEK
jgi:hypothetical protein